MNTYKPLSAPKTIFVGWLAWIALGLAFSLIVAPLLGADRAEVTAWMMVTSVVGIATGWVVGIVAWLILNGIRGWKFTAREFRRGLAEQQAQAAQDAALDISGIEVTDSEVRAMDQDYGCCYDRETPDGHIIHGGPECDHPESWRWRDRW